MPDCWRCANRPVIRKRNTELSARSRTVSTSPADTCSSMAADAGSAAGIGVPAVTEAAGHWPDTRIAWLVTPVSTAAWSRGVSDLGVLAGREGALPGTRLRGSDHDAAENAKGTPPSACPIAVRSAWLVAPV